MTDHTKEPQPSAAMAALEGQEFPGYHHPEYERGYKLALADAKEDLEEDGPFMARAEHDAMVAKLTKERDEMVAKHAEQVEAAYREGWDKSSRHAYVAIENCWQNSQAKAGLEK